MPTSLSPQIREMQGDFAEMQGEAKLTLAKSLNKLTVWVAPPYSRSREAMFPSREKPRIRGIRAWCYLAPIVHLLSRTQLDGKQHTASAKTRWRPRIGKGGGGLA